MKRRLALVFAHPDDDSFGLGGSIAMHGDGLDLLVVLATSGEAGMIADPSLATRENLGEVREGESRASYAALGVKPDLHFLHHPDGGLAEVDREALVQEIVGLLAEFRPEVVITFGPEGVTKHDDHVTIHHAGTEAFHRAREGADDGFARLLYVAIPETAIERFREMQRMAGMEPFNPEDPFQPRGVPDETIAVHVDCTSAWKTKHDALLAHATQSSEIEAIPEEARPLVFGQEHFVMGWPEREPGAPVLTDLFEGLPADD